MSGTFSHITRNHARLVHTFEDGETLTIDYRAALLTPRQIHRLQLLSDTPFEALTTAEQVELMDRTQEMLASMLIDWDAKDDTGEKIPPTLEGLEDIPYDVQAALLQWIRDDQQAPKVNGSATLPASSMPTLTSAAPTSPAALNGTVSVPLLNGSE